MSYHGNIHCHLLFYMHYATLFMNSLCMPMCWRNYKMIYDICMRLYSSKKFVPSKYDEKFRFFVTQGFLVELNMTRIRSKFTKILQKVLGCFVFSCIHYSKGWYLYQLSNNARDSFFVRYYQKTIPINIAPATRRFSVPLQYHELMKPWWVLSFCEDPVLFN